MQPVAVRILHPQPGENAGELTRLVASARSIAANELARRFRALGADDVRVISGTPDGRSFGERLRGIAGDIGAGTGFIVLGSGSIPLATDDDIAMLVGVAGSGELRGLTNNRHSSDIMSVGDARILTIVPDLPSDNALPRWLETVAGLPVAELPDRTRLGMDIDSPLDLELLRRDPRCPPPLADLARSMSHHLARAADTLDALAAIARDPRRELLVSGRLSSTGLLSLEAGTACRVRALVEERGLRASAAIPGESGDAPGGAGVTNPPQRPPASVLGLLLDREGPESIGMLVGRLGDGAIVDTRVLMAHRHGAGEAAWPTSEDRFASDLLLADHVRDHWLQQLTLHATGTRGPDRARRSHPGGAGARARAGDPDVTGSGGAPRKPFVLGLRRVDELDPAAPLPESEPRLVARITDEIRASGPMTFARFMELALYDPDAGYYTGGATGPGRHGDFLTAPEGHPIFGWAVARHLESVWTALDRPTRFVVREHGAGSGALAAGILDGLRRSRSPLFDAIAYQAVDIAPARLDALAARLAEQDLDVPLEPFDATPAPGAILANELLDALPVHRVEGGPDGGLLERFVTLADNQVAAIDEAGGLSTALGPPSSLALAARLAAEGIALEPGQPAEIGLAIDDWVAAAAAPLERGAMLLIDYGYPAAELYSPRRGSTLRAYHRHRVHADPLVAIGRQDITAHVDLTAVERAAVAAGLEVPGRTLQAHFLADLGAGELLVALQTEPGATLESYVAARSALMRMLDPRATGAFAVLAFGRGLPAASRLRGFP